MTNKSFSVLVAKKEHFEQLMPLVLLSLQETASFEVNEKKVSDYLNNAIAGNKSICGVVVESDGSIQGFVLLDISEAWYSDQKAIAEREIFVHPDFRGSKGGRARALCEFAKKVADSLSIPLYMGLEHESKTDAKVRLYERQFGNPAGTIFLYGAKKPKPVCEVEN